MTIIERTLTSPARILSFLLLLPSLPVRYILTWDIHSRRESHIYKFMTYDQVSPEEPILQKYNLYFI